MGRSGAFGVCTGLFWIVAAVTADAAPRGGFLAPGVAPRSPEIMLYFSHSIGAGAGGGGGSMRPTFGLRVQQVRQAGNSGDPEAGESMQHRELINWQMEAHSNLKLSDLRVKLGNRVTYDVTNRRFGSPSGRSAMQIGIPSLRNDTLGPTQSRPLLARNPAGTPSAAPAVREANRDNSSIREIAVAAMGALAPARFTSAQRQIAQRQGGIAGVVAAQRMQASAVR
ncbi:MAG: hypothetical protein QOI59_1949 [Gammaproteobacteria bacterium]|nr:hypothetical protein [Gammaproteobacteria bacterium]